MESQIKKVKLKEKDALLAEIALSCTKYEGYLVDQNISYGESRYIGDDTHHREHIHTIRSYLINGLRVDLEYHGSKNIADVTIFVEEDGSDKRLEDMCAEFSDFVKGNLTEEKIKKYKDRIDLVRQMSCLC